MAIRAEMLRAQRCTSERRGVRGGPRVGGGFWGPSGPAKDTRAEPCRQTRACEIAKTTGEDGEEACLGVEEEGDGTFAGSKGAHETDFAATLENGGVQGAGDGDAGVR